MAQLAGLSSADTVALTGPLTSTLHLFAAVHTLAIGGHLTDDPERATAVHAVPQRLATLLDELPRTAPLRTAVVAGGALPAAVARRCLDRGIELTEYYGAAELSFVAARRVPVPCARSPGWRSGSTPAESFGLARRTWRTDTPATPAGRSAVTLTGSPRSATWSTSAQTGR